MDMSMVATLRDQLETNEKQLTEMREAHDAREAELTAELDLLRKSLENSSITKNTDEVDPAVEANQAKVDELSAELATWETKHKAAIDALESTKSEMHTTIQQLETEIISVNAKLADSQNEVAGNGSDASRETDETHADTLKFLRSEVDEYKAIINSSTARVAELELAHSKAKAELEAMSQAAELNNDESVKREQLIAQLEEQSEAYDQAVKTHQEAMDTLKANHARELSELKALEQKSYEEQVEVLLVEHAEATQRLETQLTESRDDLMKVATQVAFALGVDVSVEKLTERIDSLIANQTLLIEEQKRVADMESHVTELSSTNENIMRDFEAAKKAISEMLAGSQGKASESVIDQLAFVKTKMSELENRSKKNSRLVEELEEQLANNFDEAQMTNNRLSTLQTERNVQLDEANAARVRMQSELDTVREDYAALQVSINAPHLIFAELY
jgi:chromosome segregation ATPase